MQDLSIVKTVDKASPVLAAKCANGEHIPRVVLTVHRPGGSNRPYMEYKLTDVIISSVQPSGSANELPLEAVSFTFREVDMTYTTSDGEVVQESIVNPGF